MSNLILNSVQFPGLDDIYINPNTIRPNLLRNWYFVGGGTGRGIFPVNQRNETVYTTQAYCIDGWEFFPYSGGTLTLDASYITFVKNDATQNPGMHQYFDGIQDGDVVTISILCTDGLASVTSEPLNSQIGSSWQVSQQMFNEKIWCGLRFVLGHWNMSFTTTGAAVIAIKVELGIQQTLAHQENNLWVLNEIPDYETELLKCQTSATHTNDLYANKILGVNVSNENFVTNWYFVGGGSQQGNKQLPINSRGLTTYTGNATFTIDRWVMRNTGNTGSPTVNVLSEGVQIVTDGASGQGLNQPIEGFRNLAGKTVTASLLITQNMVTSGSYPYFGLWNSTTATTNNTTVKAIPLAGKGTGLFTFTVTLPQNWTNNYLNIGIYFSTYVGSINVSAMKLELGTQQTLAHLEKGEWVLNEVPNYEEELIKCQTATSDSGSDLYAHGVVSINTPKPNLVDNWYFIGGGSQLGEGSFPINQRGQTSYTVAGYCIDRWYSQRTTHTLTLQSGCIHWERVNNVGYNPLFYQSVRVVQGEVYTYSILYRSTFRKLRETFTAALLPEASDWTLYSKTATVSGASANIGVQDISYNQGLDDTGKYVEIKAIKLELGTEQTLAHWDGNAWVLNEIPDYGRELYECQRYLKQVINWSDIYAARSDTTNLYFFIPGAMMARVPDTLTSQQVYFYSGSNYYTITDDVTFTRQYSGIRGSMPKGSIPNNIGGSLVFPSVVYISAE